MTTQDFEAARAAATSPKQAEYEAKRRAHDVEYEEGRAAWIASLKREVAEAREARAAQAA